jgi:hypothetical protein
VLPPAPAVIVPEPSQPQELVVVPVVEPALTPAAAVPATDSAPAAGEPATVTVEPTQHEVAPQPEARQPEVTAQAPQEVAQPADSNKLELSSDADLKKIEKELGRLEKQVEGLEQATMPFKDRCALWVAKLKENMTSRNVGIAAAVVVAVGISAWLVKKYLGKKKTKKKVAQESGAAVFKRELQEYSSFEEDAWNAVVNDGKRVHEIGKDLFLWLAQEMQKDGEITVEQRDELCAKTVAFFDAKDVAERQERVQEIMVLSFLQ